MSHPAEKSDSLLDVHFDTKEMGVSEKAASMPPNYDITLPQSYDLKSTKTDMIYSGAYSLRVHGTDNEVWKTKIHPTYMEIFRSDGTLIGNVGLKCWSGKVPITMHESDSVSEFTMSGKGHGFKGFMGERKSFDAHGHKLTWRRAAKVNSKFELTDEAGNALAWVGSTSWKGRYQVQILKAGMSPELVETCVVTALATAENEKRLVWAVTTNASTGSTA